MHGTTSDLGHRVVSVDMAFNLSEAKLKNLVINLHEIVLICEHQPEFLTYRQANNQRLAIESYNT